MAVSNATLGKSMKTFKAGNRKFASGVSKLTKGVKAVNEGKAPVFKGDVKGASKFYPKRDVAATRAEMNRPKHQTSNWSKQKSSAEIGNYLAWKYSGFKKGGY